MSVIDKKLLLEELGKRVGEIVPSGETRRILAAAGEILERYNVEAFESPAEADASEGLIRLFLDAKASEGRSDKTLERYGYILRRLHKNIAAPLDRVTVYHLRSFISSEMERGISASTLEGSRSIWCGFFGWLKTEELISRNPCANLAPLRTPKEIRRPFSPEELVRINDAAETARDRALISFLAATGCRVSEACSVNREDINFRDLQLQVVGKGNKERTVYIDAACALRLRAWLAEREDDEPALFINRYGERIEPGGVRDVLGRVAARAGVEGVHPHRFRRTLATQLINRGMSLQEVAAILGHSKLDTTMTYVFVDEQRVEQAYRRYA